MTEQPSTHAHGEPRWHRRKEERPAEILDAALEEFVAKGFAATRLEDIARRAGCTKGTIFLYFENKQELFKEVVRASVVPRLQRAEQIVEQHQGSMDELLGKVLRARWEGLQHSSLSGLPKLMFSEARNFPDLARFYHDEIVQRSQAILERILRTGIERGEFRPLDVPHVARVAVTPMLLAALWRHSFHDCVAAKLDPDAYFEAALDLLRRGIARDDARPAGAAR